MSGLPMFPHIGISHSLVATRCAVTATHRRVNRPSRTNTTTQCTKPLRGSDDGGEVAQPR